MNVIIFGATGGTGRQAVQAALAAGHQVRAFVRRPEAVGVQHAHLGIVQGDVLRPDAVNAAMEGQEAVLSSLGPPAGTAPGTIISDGVRNILAAMKTAGSRRLVFESGLMMGGAGASVVSKVMIAVFRQLNRSLYEDKLRAEALVRESTVEWVMVRPPRLVHAPGRGAYRSGVDLAASPAKAMSHADVADFMVKALADPQWTGKAVELSY